MKKIIILSLLVLFGIGGFAQNNQAIAKKTPEQRAEQITMWMNKKLTLTADQKTKIYDINLKYAKLNQEAKASDSTNRRTLHQEIKANEKERDADYKTILTVDQYQAYQAAKQQLAERRMGRRGQR